MEVDYMQITYINHSGFLLETEKSYILFDYYKNEIPTMDNNKSIYIFSSHSHDDHFNPKVLELSDKYSDITYIFSKDIQKKNKSEKPVTYVKANENYSIGDLKITTLKSTDLGVAFVVKTEGMTIYHAGDLNDWVWSGETKAYNNNMTANFQREIDKIKGIDIDYAFVPLDPRQEDDYFRGAKYLLENTTVKTMFPMHFWGDFSVIKKFKREYSFENTKIIEIEKDLQQWNF